jgi:hypothetical protein
VERQEEESKNPTAATIIADNEAAANDADIEEHLPGSPDEDEAENSDHDEDIAEDQEEQARQETSQEERPVGVVSEAPAEDTATYAGRKQAALHRIRSLCGQRVVIEKNRNEFLEWTVVAELQPDDDDEDIDECVGLKNLSEVTRDRYDILLAHLFLHLTFKVSIVLRKMLFFNVCMFLLLPFSVSHL